MSGIRLEVDDSQVVQALVQLRSRVNNIKPALQQIGALVTSLTQLRFISQTGPTGEAWKPSRRALGQGTTRSRKKDGPNRGDTLADTGRLLASINWKLLSGSAVAIGTNVEYASTMQFGAAKGQFGTVMAKVSAFMRRVPTRDVFAKTGRLRKRGMTEVRAHERRMLVPCGTIPARPFLGFNSSDIDDILAILSNHMRFG